MSLLNTLLGKEKKRKSANENTIDKLTKREKKHAHAQKSVYGGYVPTKRILRYKVKGTNPETGRRKTVKNVYVGSWGLYPETVAGINPPYEFILDDETITDPQRELFERHKIKIPSGINKNDAIAVISHIVCDSSDDPHPFFEPQLPDEMLEEAVRKQLYLPSYLSMKEARKFLDGKEWRPDI